jgi:dTDP-4-amino-4,6-dideoxygalactose transaminase
VETTVAFVGLKEQAVLVRARIEAALGRVLDHGQYVNGPEIAALEARLAELGGGAAAVCVASGTDALLMALMASGVGRGDAVFVPSFTFTATAEVVLIVGAEPVFVDVDERSFNLDALALAEAVARVRTAGRLRPRSVIAVDLFGLPADYPALELVAAREGLVLIDDAAQSFGASRGTTPVGALAPITTTSFFPAKPLGGYGDGGAILVTDGSLAAVLRSIREHGRGEDRYDIVRLGINGRLDTFQAAVLLVKLEVFAQELERRQALAVRYRRELAEHVVCPLVPEGVRSAWAQYTVQVEASRRDAFRAELSERGVPTAVYYPLPMHLQPAYREYGEGEGSLPVSERLASRVVSLPMNPYLDEAAIERVIGAVCDATATVKG